MSFIISYYSLVHWVRFFLPLVWQPVCISPPAYGRHSVIPVKFRAPSRLSANYIDRPTDARHNGGFVRPSIRRSCATAAGRASSSEKGD